MKTAINLIETENHTVCEILPEFTNAKEEKFKSKAIKYFPMACKSFDKIILWQKPEIFEVF